MIERRNLTQYEKILLASAYNLKHYCYRTTCSECIFKSGRSTCILTDPYNPCSWELYMVKWEDGDKHGQT